VPLCGLVGRQFGRQPSSCRPTVEGAVGEQRLYAHHGALPPSYLSTVEKCSVVISLAPQRDDQLGRSAAAPNARLQAAEHAREIPQVTGFHPANGLLIAAPAARGMRRAGGRMSRAVSDPDVGGACSTCHLMSPAGAAAWLGGLAAALARHAQSGHRQDVQSLERDGRSVAFRGSVRAVVEPL
jgi:hypothetical protein